MRACRVCWRAWGKLRCGEVNSGDFSREYEKRRKGANFLADYGDTGDARGCHRCFCGCVVELVGALGWVLCVLSNRWRDATLKL